ncbi:MAG TPA: sensor domain-containing diguanylate cyclase [Gemmatimonadaceae bacterium]|nr:sensor domain-containing diguanylate cyclase [Gemmatimonadaceae bacterium]
MTGRPSPAPPTLRAAVDEPPPARNPPALRALSIVAAWLICIGALYALRHGPAMPGWVSLLAAACNALALGVGLIASARRLPSRVYDHFTTWLLIASAPLFLLIELTGGLRSPAVLVPGFVALGIAWRGALWHGAAVAALWLAALLAAGMALHHRIDTAWFLSVAFAVFALGIIPIVYSRQAAVAESRARHRLARVEGYLADRRMTPLGSDAIVSPGDLKSERQAQFQTAEGLRHIDALDRYLRDVRDTMGADEVVFWRFNEARQTQRAAAWSTEGASSPRYFEREPWGPLVRWAAESGQVQAVAEQNVVYFVVAPVRDGARVHGAVSISSRAGLTHTPDGARRWAARHAAHAAVLLDLLDLRREASRHLLSTPALVKAAERLQAAKSTDALGVAICQTAVEVTSAQRSALVRWDPEHETGTVMAVSRGHALAPGLAIDGDSLVAEQCSMRKLLHKEDARMLRGAVLYGRGEGKRDLGGLAVVPLARAEIGVIGAIVIESDEPDMISRREVENVNLLGVIAARQLETAWEIEEEWRRARTDPLTGLSNRRHFDEQMARIVSDSLAHGTPASLVVADVDHFKKVNDTYGHEAGDAVLKAVARVFLDCLRAEDVCARYGGEEIAILLPETSVARAQEVAERVRRAIEAKPIAHGDRRITVTASFGVAGYPESTAVRDALFPTADRALYEAKAGGRNRVTVAAAPVHGRTSQS